jgi:RNA polymerase sigma-70 factor (ECF subfamily)
VDARSPLSDAPDGILAARAADGDAAAFEALMRRFGPMLRAYAVKVLGSNDEADDVVQESFINAWNHVAELADVTAVRSWLMRLVSNKAIERIRRRKYHSDITEWDAPGPARHTPERQVEASLQMRALSEALGRLPAEQRECWVLKEVGGLAYADIAEELDLPVSTVRGLLARARSTLLKDMEEWR